MKRLDQLTLDGGVAMLELPDTLTEADARDLREFLLLVLKREERLARNHATTPPSRPTDAALGEVVGGAAG